MAKQKPAIEWQIAQNDAEWDALRRQRPPGAHPGDGASPRLVRWRRGVLLLLLVLAGAGAWYLYERGVPADPLAEERLILPSSAPPSTAPAPPDPITTTATGTINTDDAMSFRRQESFSSSEVVSMLSHPERALLTNQYAHMESLRSALEAGLWGTEERLESQFFVLHFRQKDAPTVIKVAPRLDALVVTISQNLGVTPLAGAQKLVIEVGVQRERKQPASPPAVNEQMIVISPFLFALPDERSHEDLLTQSIVLPLIDRTLARAADQYQLGSTRAPMISALRLWQLWALDLPLAKWRPNVVRWIFLDLPTALPGDNPPLPTGYDELCIDHALWMPNPAQLQIPLLCMEADQSAWLLSSQLAHVAPTHLAPLAVLVLSDEQAAAQRRTRPRPHPGETVALATLIEYVAAHFGREQLPIFVAALGQHESWATLTPAVFGHSVEEFETDWQSYLQEHYLR